jgi:hypothetical protein
MPTGGTPVAAFVPIRNCSPLGALDVVIDGDVHTVERGGVLRVTTEAAGAAPSWRPVTPGEDVAGRATRETGGVVEVLDLGYGLLAQPDNWQPDAPAATATPKEK